jgi:prenyltransferase beta subunit
MRLLQFNQYVCGEITVFCTLQTYEGSFTSGHCSEGHAAYTFCAVASLSMLGKIYEVLSEEEVMLTDIINQIFFRIVVG